MGWGLGEYLIQYWECHKQPQGKGWSGTRLSLVPVFLYFLLEHLPLSLSVVESNTLGWFCL